MVTTVTSQSAADRSISDAWPRCSDPIVGTSPTRAAGGADAVELLAQHVTPIEYARACR